TTSAAPLTRAPPARGGRGLPNARSDYSIAPGPRRWQGGGEGHHSKTSASKILAPKRVDGEHGKAPNEGCRALLSSMLKALAEPAGPVVASGLCAHSLLLSSCWLAFRRRARTRPRS